MPEYQEVEAGTHCKVLMARKVAKEFAKAPAKDVARCKRMMKRFAEDGPANFTPEQLKMEGRFPSGKRGVADVAIWVFKSYQVRIYGGYFEDRFLCVEYDLKKRKQADQNKLRRAAKAICEGM